MIGGWYMKWVGEGGDIGGDDLGDEEIDCGEIDGDRVGDDGGEKEARRPVRLKSSGLVDKFSGSSVTIKKYLVNIVQIVSTEQQASKS